MKLSLKNLISTQKRLIIFFFALAMPLLVIAYLGFNTLSERQKSTQRILESNLLVTGGSALNQVEDELLRIEEEILGSIFAEHEYSELTTIFLLDDNYEILYPNTGNVRNRDADLININLSPFEEKFKVAEFYEFLERDYTNAIRQYQECFDQAGSRRDQALSLEGMGRCKLSLANYVQAAEFYQRLYSDYTSVYNKVGHPYGIIGLFQLYEINKHNEQDEEMVIKLLDTYKKLKDGLWKLNTSSFRFFLSEIEEILGSELSQGSSAGLDSTFQSLLATPSLYLEDLKFSDFLQESVIVKMKESVVLTSSAEDPQIRRIIENYEGKWNIISYRQLRDPDKDENYIRGLCWEKNTLRDSIIQPILERISTETGLSLSLKEENDSLNLAFQEKEKSLSFTFRNFPYPGKLQVVQPALSLMGKDSRKEIIIYGLLLGIIIILMTLGAVLLARDIKRETDAMNLKTEFVHNVSHELKTPLSVIRLYGETLLLKQDLPENDRRESLYVITKESERLSHMINNILDFSKIEMGRKEFQFQKGNFAKVIRDTLDSYRYHLEKKGFRIIEEIAQDIPLMHFDKEAIEGLLVNLLSNAVKFSPEKKILTVKLNREEENIKLEVTDAGIGIAPREIAHIFDRFYRTKQKSGFEARGSGLGLTLVKHVVESHNGSISVKSMPGEGSTFSIIIPVSGS